MYSLSFLLSLPLLSLLLSLDLLFLFLSGLSLLLYRILSLSVFLFLLYVLLVISLISTNKLSLIDSFCEFKHCLSAYISYTLDSTIIKSIRYYNSSSEISRLDSFLIAFLNAIINYSRFR